MALLAFSLAVPAFAEKNRNHFDSDAPMRAPAFFDFSVFGNPARAEWMVLAEANTPSATNQVTQTIAGRPEDSIAAALRRNVAFRDGRVSVAVRRGSSGAGLVFRVVDDRNFLVLLLDAGGGEAKLTAYRNGVATPLATSKIRIDREWGFLVVDLSGPDVRAQWNETDLLRGKDPAPAAGRAGLAALGRASFDELVFDPKAAGGKKP